MATELNMPQMGYDMEQGTVVRWLKSEGEEVDLGEPIAEIETDKAVVEFESTAKGVLRKVLVNEGTTVDVGKAIGIVGEADEEIPDVVEEAPAAEAPAEPEEEPKDQEPAPIAVPAPASDAPPAPADGPVRASPVARRMAEELGIDLRQINGTGPGGRITKSDVTDLEPGEAPAAPAVPAPAVAASAPAAATPPAAAPAAATSPGTAEAAAVDGTAPLSKMRQQIARVTSRSKQEIPHFYVSTEVNMTEAMELRRQINEGLEAEGTKVSVNDLVLKAAVGALKRYPKFNAAYTSDGLEMHEQINIGISIAEEDGLIVPAVMDSGNKSLAELARATKDLIERSKSGTLHPQEYTGGTFSTSNMGMFDVTSFVAIIQPPQAAMLAVGTVSKRPVVKDDEIVVAQIMTATVSVDHRVADGAEAAQFIGVVKSLLENPMSLLV